MSGGDGRTAGDALVEIEQELDAADTQYAQWLADQDPVRLVLAISRMHHVLAEARAAITAMRAEGRMARQAAAEIDRLLTEGSD